jgi:hypothetical protein
VPERPPSSGVQLSGVSGVGATQYGAGQLAASPSVTHAQGGTRQTSDELQLAPPQVTMPLSFAGK